MGFKPTRTHYKLVFEDPDMSGLEVVATAMNMKMFIDAAAMTTKTAAELATDVDGIDRLFSAFAECLVSWNLEDDNDNPVPPTKDGLYSQNFEFIMEVITAWGKAVASVSAPLPNASSSGSQSLEESLTMEPLSPNQPSLPAPN